MIRKNTKELTDDPVLTVKTYKDNNYAHEAIIRTKDGREVVRVVYRPHDPLSCGAEFGLRQKQMTIDVELVERKDLIKNFKLHNGCY